MPRIALVLLSICLPINMVADFLDTGNRWLVRDWYHAHFSLQEPAAIEWTGSYASANAGSVSPQWQDAVFRKIQYYRAMAGVPNEHLVLRPELSAMSQQAALMMSIAGRLDHFPQAGDPAWTYYSAAGAQAAARANLALNYAGVDAVEGYIADHGPGNEKVGHRRWLLYPQLEELGNGDVPGQSADPRYFRANAMWIVPPSLTPRVATRDNFVAWPAPGYTPAQVVYPRWSFSFPGADFSAATVSMTEGGVAVPLRIDARSSELIGEPTIVWVPFEMDCSQLQHWPIPQQDRRFEVTVANFMAQGLLRSFKYEVVVIAAEQRGVEEPLSPLVYVGKLIADYPATINYAHRPWGDGVEVRWIAGVEDTFLFDGSAESLPVIEEVSAGYEPYNAKRKFSGDRAYALFHPEFEDQSLRLADAFIVSGQNPRLRFHSSLAWATEIQQAIVEVRIVGSGVWQTLWVQSGPAEANSAFEAVEISMADFSMDLIEIRFRYGLVRGRSDVGYYNQVLPVVGWAFDNILLTGLARVSDIIEPGGRYYEPSFELDVPDVPNLYLQAREYIFDGVPTAWGRLLTVADHWLQFRSGRWSNCPILGLNYTTEDGNWIFSQWAGWVSPARSPWLFTAIGWVAYLQGNFTDGIWLYSIAEGFIYLPPESDGRYFRAPFGAADSDRLRP